MTSSSGTPERDQYQIRDLTVKLGETSEDKGSPQNVLIVFRLRAMVKGEANFGYFLFFAHTPIVAHRHTSIRSHTYVHSLTPIGSLAYTPMSIGRHPLGSHAQVTLYSHRR